MDNFVRLFFPSSIQTFPIGKKAITLKYFNYLITLRKGLKRIIPGMCEKPHGFPCILKSRTQAVGVMANASPTPGFDDCYTHGESNLSKFK
jgi:hypothetical protein